MPIRRTRDALRAYQKRAVEFVKKRRYSALFIDMGLGKSIIALSAIVDLLRSREIENVLLVAPVRVVYGVWEQEAQVWQHTRWLKFSIVHGTVRQRIEALHKPAHVHLINPEGLIWLREYYKGKPWPFDMLVVDESSMFKRPNVKRFRALRSAMRHFKRRIIMTGTPTPNSLLELWPQMFLVDGGVSLGQSFVEYRKDNFRRTGYMGYKLEPVEGASERITESISSRVVALNSADYLQLPPFVEDPIWVDLPRDARVIYDQMERDMFLAIEDDVLEIDNAAGLTMRCSQIASGSLWMRNDDGEKVWRAIHDAKLQALAELLDELQGQRPLIAYRFQPDLFRLKAAYPHFTVMGKGTSPKKTRDIEAAWNAGKLEGLIAHPASAGHGLNLQHGGHNLVWFSPTWSLEQYQQFCKRLHRSGQVHPVMNHLILARGTTDEAVMEAIRHKDRGQNAVKQALANYYEANRGGILSRPGARRPPQGRDGALSIL